MQHVFQMCQLLSPLYYKANFIAEQTNLVVDGNRIWHMGQRH